MVDLVPAKSEVVQTLKSLLALSQRHVDKNLRYMRVPLRIPARGEHCKLFYRHGPVGRVLDRFTVLGKTVVVAEFDAEDVLTEVKSKLGMN